MTGLGSALLAIAALLAAFAILYLANNLYSKKADSEKIKSAFWALLGVFAAVTAASAILMIALVRLDISFLYVSSHTSSDLAVAYRIAAFWAGHEGSLLLWLWLIGLFTVILGFGVRKKPQALDGFAFLGSALVQLFFLVVLMVAAKPFEAAPPGMNSGMGMNPLLLHWAMVAHPPTLFMGFALTTIPFGYALGALVLRDRRGEWLPKAQRWAILAWLFLGIGNFLGALWAYVVLGWGGYWGWDPVENASILPWLTATALVHSLHTYRQRGSFKHWSLALAGGTFLLCIIGTFITRSGLIESVHAFGRNDLIAALFISFILGVLAYFTFLLFSRSKDFASEHPFESLTSKEFGYYLNNLILVVSMAIILFTVLVPPFFGRTYGADFYNLIARPVGLLYLVLITICPMLTWGTTKLSDFLRPIKWPLIITAVASPAVFYYWLSLENLVATVKPFRSPSILGFIGLLLTVLSLSSTMAAFWRWIRRLEKQKGVFFLQALAGSWRINPRRFGAYTAHIGIALLFAGLIGSSMYVIEIKKTIDEKPGEKIEVADLTLRFKESRYGTALNQDRYEAVFEVFNRATGKKIEEIAPAVVFYQLQQRDAPDVEINRKLQRDVFIIYEGKVSENQLSMRILINPLIFLVWLGSSIMITGTTVALWPRSRKEELEEAA